MSYSERKIHEITSKYGTYRMRSLRSVRAMIEHARRTKTVGAYMTTIEVALFAHSMLSMQRAINNEDHGVSFHQSVIQPLIKELKQLKGYKS